MPDPIPFYPDEDDLQPPRMPAPAYRRPPQPAPPARENEYEQYRRDQELRPTPPNIAIATVMALIVIVALAIAIPVALRSRSAPPASAPEPIQIAIMPQQNPRVTSVSGTGDIPQGEHLRIFVYAPGIKLYYADGDASIPSPHHWTASVILGSTGPSDNGQTFTIYALLIDDATAAQIATGASYTQHQWDQNFAKLPGASAQATRATSNAPGATAPSAGGFALPMTATRGAPSLTAACRWQYPGHPKVIAEHIAGSNPVASYTVQCVDADSDLGGIDLDGYCGSLIGGMQADEPDRFGQASDVPAPWNQWECVPK
jgi:hypothetical protein